MVCVCIYVRYILIEKFALFVPNAVIPTVTGEKRLSQSCPIEQKNVL